MRGRLADEIKSFQGLWHGGYFEGDPLDSMAKSKYGHLGFMSVLHVAYLRCIKPFVNAETVVLEIGPGRGAWTRAMLGAREVWCLDALPEEHNRFYEYLGHPAHVRYIQVTDFSCSMLPDDYFDYNFSFGCLCHISFEGITEYAGNLFRKLREGSNCFWMIADYDKYNRAQRSLKELAVASSVIPPGNLFAPLRWLVNLRLAKAGRHQLQTDEDQGPAPGRWYHAGIERTCSMLERIGYRVIDEDVGVNHRDPVIHFVKP